MWVLDVGGEQDHVLIPQWSHRRAERNAASAAALAVLGVAVTPAGGLVSSPDRVYASVEPVCAHCWVKLMTAWTLAGIRFRLRHR